MKTISFPKFTGIRCLMMPYVQGDPNSDNRRYLHAMKTLLFRALVLFGIKKLPTLNEAILKFTV